MDDVLVATPKDFGFYGKGEGEGDGRYTPLRSAASHERFRADLTRMIGLVLDGRKEAARAQAAPSGEALARGDRIAALPEFSLVTLDGRTVTRESLAGRVVLVEFWATWCPPCRGALKWLGDLKRRQGEAIEVVALAVESDEAAVRDLAKAMDLPLVWGMGAPDLARAFGDVTAVPTLLMFDADGRLAEAYYGAPPELHDAAETRLAALTRRPPAP